MGKNNHTFQDTIDEIRAVREHDEKIAAWEARYAEIDSVIDSLPGTTGWVTDGAQDFKAFAYTIIQGGIMSHAQLAVTLKQLYLVVAFEELKKIP